METSRSATVALGLVVSQRAAASLPEASATANAPDQAWMRRFEQVRLGGDALEMSELSLAAARRSLDELDIEACLSHLHRVDRLLAAARSTPRMLGVLGDMAELTLHAASVARGLSEEEDPLRMRRLGELMRDRCYAVTARLDRVEDAGVRSAVRLRMASLLEAGGDLADAQAMRAAARAAHNSPSRLVESDL